MKNFLKIILSAYFFFPFLWVDGGRLSAQQHNFTKYSVESGIQSQVQCITQDSRGYMWFGTNNGGVALFDGKTFSFFKKENGLTNNNISSICEDKLGNIWIGTSNGIDKYDGKKFTHIDTKDSIYVDANQIRQIICDKKGKIWIATEDKIKIFDGTSFHWFGYEKFENVKLNHSKVYKLFQDSKENIWFGFKPGKSDGVDKYDGKKITHYKISNLLGEFGGDFVGSFAESKSGKLWLGICGYYRTVKRRVFTIEHDSVYEFVAPETDKINVQDMLMSSSGSLWLATLGGLTRISGEGISSTSENNSKVNLLIKDGSKMIMGRTRENSEAYDTVLLFDLFNKKYGLPNENVHCVFEDKEHNLWFGTDYGIIKYSNDAFLHFGEKDNVNGPVFHIAQDNAEKIWIMFDGGKYNVLERNGFVSFQDSLNKTEKNKNALNGFLRSKSGDIWFGSSKFSDVIRVQGDKLTHIKKVDRVKDLILMPLCEDDKGNIWFSGGRNHCIVKYSIIENKFFCFPETDTLNAFITNILIDKNGTTWLTLFNKGLGKIENGKINMIEADKDLDVWDLKLHCEDKFGNLWITNGNDGVYKYADKKFMKFNAANGFTNEGITCFLKDKAGDVWFGTDGDGIFKFDGNNFRNYKSKKELTDNPNNNVAAILNNNTIMSLVEDDNGNIWVGTNKGINKLFFDEKGLVLKYKSYGYSEGFIGIECNTNAAFKDNRGCLWFGTSTVLTKYNPKEDVPSEIPPKLNLTGITMFYEKIDWQNFADSLSPWNLLPVNLILPYNKNHLTFSYVGISHRSPEAVRYRFMLEGLDTAWSQKSNKTEITYSNLSPGKYIFKVKARNENSDYKEPVTFSFEIKYPWYRTWIAYAMYFISGGGAIFLFIKYRTKKLEAEKKKLEETVKERTHQLEEQKIVVEEKNKEVMDSIRYASRIQRALITSEKYIERNLKRFHESIKNKT